MGMKEAYVERMEAELRDLTDRIDELRAKGSRPDAKVEAEYEKQLEALRSSLEATLKKPAELKTAGEGMWEEIKAGVDLAWSELKKAVEDTSTKFK